MAGLPKDGEGPASVGKIQSRQPGCRSCHHIDRLVLDRPLHLQAEVNWATWCDCWPCNLAWCSRNAVQLTWALSSR